MSAIFKKRFERTDAWREGKWLDLWSVVHFLTGILIGLGFFYLHFGSVESVLLTLVSLIAYELWEMLVHIEETPTNRVMDVVVGMTSFLLTFFVLAPHQNLQTQRLMFGFVLLSNLVLSTLGWRASQKAAELEKSMRAKYAKQRARLFKRKEKLQDIFRDRN